MVEDDELKVELNIERRQERERRRRMARPPGPGDNILLTPGNEARNENKQGVADENDEVIIPPRLPNG